MYAIVHVYTRKVTFYKLPEKHGHVKLVTLYMNECDTIVEQYEGAVFSREPR